MKVVEKLVTRLIGTLERIHTLVALTMLLVWEIQHFYVLLFQNH
jgi:hypothetical protein